MSNNCTTNHAFMFFFVLSFLLVYNHAFFSSSPSKSTKSKSRNPSCSCNCPAAVASSAADPTITLFLAFLSGVLFTLLCILTIRFPALFTVPIQSAVDFSSSCVRRIKSIRASPLPRQPIVHQYSFAAIGGGISASLLNSLPIFVYSGEKRHNFGKDAGLCAICLSEFLNEQTLRWLPDCDHLFHRKCIDTWLDSHKTCPCCRANVDRAGEEIALFENGEISASPEIGSSFRRLPRGDRGRDLDDRRRIGCERNIVTGLIRILMGRRRNNSNRHR